MTKTLERNLVAMTLAEREVAIEKLCQIRREITKYSKSYFWKGHGKTRWQTQLTVELGTDVIAFRSDYHESYRNCYYSKSLTFNGKKTTCTLVNNIIDKLCELNANSVNIIFLGEEDLYL